MNAPHGGQRAKSPRRDERRREVIGVVASVPLVGALIVSLVAVSAWLGSARVEISDVEDAIMRDPAAVEMARHLAFSHALDDAESGSTPLLRVAGARRLIALPGEMNEDEMTRAARLAREGLRLEEAGGGRGAAREIRQAALDVARHARIPMGMLISVGGLSAAPRPLDLSGLDLTGMDFSGARLAGSSMRYASARRVAFRDADMRAVDLTGASLEESDLAGANLTGASLERANLHASRLRGARLEGGSLGGARLSRADLTGADLAGASFRGGGVSGASLEGADLTGADFSEAAGLRAEDFRGAFWRRGEGPGGAPEMPGRLGMSADALASAPPAP